MSPWTLASVALVPAMALSAVIAWRGRLGQRFAAYQLAGTITVILLTLLTFATDQPALGALALTLVLLTFPRVLLLAAPEAPILHHAAEVVPDFTHGIGANCRVDRNGYRG